MSANNLIELSFSTTDLMDLEHLLHDLFRSNSLYFERLASALSRIGLSVGLSTEVSLVPFVDQLKKEVVKTLKKGMTYVKAQQD